MDALFLIVFQDKDRCILQRCGFPLAAPLHFLRIKGSLLLLFSTSLEQRFLLPEEIQNCRQAESGWQSPTGQRMGGGFEVGWVLHETIPYIM